MPCKPLYFVWGPITIKQRVMCAIMLHFALLNAYHLRVVLNIAITEMQGTPNVTNSKREDPCPHLSAPKVKTKEAKFHWTSEEEAFILYGFYIGYLLSHVPGGWLCDKFGARHVMGTCMMLAAVVNLFYPLTILEWGKTPAIVLRVIIGFSQGPLFPAVSSFIQFWVPTSERAFLGGIAYSGSNLGTVTGFIFSGIMIHYANSWSIPFYAFSILAMIWYIFHLLIVFSRPETHPFVTQEELEHLEKIIPKKRKLRVPWLEILLSPAVWALICGQFSHNILFFTLFTNLPKYLNEILKMDIKSNAMSSALPFFLLWIYGLLWGYLADVIIRKQWLTLLTVRKLWTFLAAFLPAAFVIIAGYVGCNQTAGVILFTVGIMTIGPFYGGMKVNINDISVNYGGSVMAIVNGLGSTAGILGPFLVGALTKNGTLKSWQLTFWIMGGISMGTLLIFIIFAKGERQKWDYTEEEKEEAN